MTPELWERVKRIPGPWMMSMNIIMHRELEDSLGNMASIQVALVFFETGSLYCNCCTRGLARQEHPDLLTEDEYSALGALAWVNPPTIEEWGEDPKAAREKYAGVPKVRTPYQEILLDGWRDPEETRHGHPA